MINRYENERNIVVVRKRDIAIISDPELTRIPINECEENLVDIRTLCPGMSIDFAPEDDPKDPAIPYTKMRRTVAERLEGIQSYLKQEGMALQLVDGFRTIQDQERYFTNQLNAVARERGFGDISSGSMTPEEHAGIYHAASLVVCPPDRTPPHTTGGAVDVRLIRTDGTPLDFGPELNDTSTDTHDPRFQSFSIEISTEAKRNRDKLLKTMYLFGFRNYRKEWWHYEMFTRLWAFYTNNPHASYGVFPTDNISTREKASFEWKYQQSPIARDTP